MDNVTYVFKYIFLSCRNHGSNQMLLRSSEIPSRRFSRPTRTASLILDAEKFDLENCFAAKFGQKRCGNFLPQAGGD